MKTAAIWSRLRRARQVVQILAFAFYLYLLFAALQRRAAFPLADLFFRLDPLAAIAAMLASQEWIPRLALALVTLGLTLVLGRVWCGWLCPLGSLLDWIRFRGARRRAERLSPRWVQVKNFLLLTILVMALLGNLSLLILDPLTVLTRTMTTVVIPGLNHAITSLERFLYPIGLLRPAIDGLESLLRGPVLPVEQPVFVLNLLLALFFLAILALNALGDRFWCRFLCPLGALLGLLSKFSWLRPVIGPACNRCTHCVSVCRVDAIDVRQGYRIDPGACTVCLDCLEACPESGIGFRPHGHPAPWLAYDPSRRQAMKAMVTGALSVVVLRTGTHAKRRHPGLLRPPGAQDEDAFLARCLRCSQCMKVCPTAGLQPTLTEAGVEGMWTPRLTPRLGHCDYGCNACGQVCPSGAIPLLDLEAKRQTIIGLATIDQNRCWPWAYGIPCIVCEEMCPVPEKAIKLDEVVVADAQGEPITVQQPRVVSDLCIGCGICENRCPVEGEAAIRVYCRN